MYSPSAEKNPWRRVAHSKRRTIGPFASRRGGSRRRVDGDPHDRALAFQTVCAPKRANACSRRCVAFGYTPNEAARALRAGASRMVLVVVPYLYSGVFFSGVINGIDAELSAEGYTMIVGSLDGIADKARRLVDLVYARRIDGVIILTGQVPVIDGRSLRDAGVPLVSICCQMDMPLLPTVLVNDEECAIAQTRHLIDLGHRNLLYVSGPEDHYNEIVRYRGYLKAATASNAKTLRYTGAYTFESGAAAARYFLNLDRRPTGVVCCSDEMAIGFIKTVTGAGVGCPAMFPSSVSTALNSPTTANRR